MLLYTSSCTWKQDDLQVEQIITAIYPEIYTDNLTSRMPKGSPNIAILGIHPKHETTEKKIREDKSGDAERNANKEVSQLKPTIEHDDASHQPLKPSCMAFTSAGMSLARHAGMQFMHIRVVPCGDGDDDIDEHAERALEPGGFAIAEEVAQYED